MRAVTRNALVAIVGVLAVLLALGALPAHIATGDPYYVEATAADAAGPAVAGENLSERRFPYSFGAVAAAEAGADPARSEAYYSGVVGFKAAFTHTPFEEFQEFETRTTESRYRVPFTRRWATSPTGPSPRRSTASGARVSNSWNSSNGVWVKAALNPTTPE